MAVTIDTQADSFRLDPDNEQLWRGEQKVRLTPKAFAMLCYLAKNPNKLLTKQNLLANVWPDTQVVESQVKRYIREVRIALADDPAAPRFIETVRGRGYRFIGDIPAKTSSAAGIVSPVGGDIKALLDACALIAPLGREHELRQLYSALQQALAGKLQIVFISGEAGIGKTLLLDTFIKSLSDYESLCIGGGYCIEHAGTGEPYLPVLEALNQFCLGLHGAEVSACLERYAPLWLLQLPGLESVDFDRLQQRTQGATRERMLRELAQALEVLSAGRRIVLWLEDLHWADNATLDLLAYLAHRRQPARLLVVATHRPEDMYEHNHPLARLQPELKLHGHCKELLLPLLSETLVERYLALQFPGLPPALGGILHRHTDGNPLFLLNVIEHLLSQGVIVESNGFWRLQDALQSTPEAIRLELPDNLRRLIEMHYGKLSSADQQLLAAASVAGVGFAAAALAPALGLSVDAVEMRCEDLARHGRWIRAQSQAQWPDNTVTASYIFCHGLYQEVLYQRVTPHQRSILHCAIAERLQQAYGERSEEIAVELAHHFEQGNNKAGAVHYLHQAAALALRRSAHHEASSHLRRALLLLDALPADAERNQQELALLTALGVSLMAIRGWADAEVETVYKRARALSQQVEDSADLYPVLWGLWLFYGTRAQYTTARELQQRALRLAQRLHNPIYLMAAHGMRGDDLFWIGEFSASRIHYEYSIALDDDRQQEKRVTLYGLDFGVASRGCVAHALWFLGYADQAHAKAYEALALAEQSGHPFSLAWALGHTARVHAWRGEIQETQQQSEAALALASEHGFAYILAWSAFYLAWAQAENSQCGQGHDVSSRRNTINDIARIYDALATFETSGIAVGLSLQLVMLAQAHARQKQVDQGLALLDKAQAFIHKSGERLYEAELYRIKGELLRYRSAEQAQGCFKRAIDAARRQHAKALELRAALSFARLWQSQGNQNDAGKLLASIYAWFREGLATADLKEAAQLLDIK